MAIERACGCAIRASTGKCGMYHLYRAIRIAGPSRDDQVMFSTITYDEAVAVAEAMERVYQIVAENPCGNLVYGWYGGWTE